MSIDFSKPTDTGQIIHEVNWRLRRQLPADAYQSDLRYAEDLRLSVHEWRGEDREGRPTVVSWVATPNGRLLAAYEIRERP